MTRARPDATLVKLLKQPTGSDDAGYERSERIAQHLTRLGIPAGGLGMMWFPDATAADDGNPVLMAQPLADSGPAAEDQFARAVVALTGGTYDTYATDPGNDTVFEAKTTVAGVATIVEHLVWSYEDADAAAARLSAFIKQHQS